MIRSPLLIVLAKEPIPGHVKTRLVPPCTHEEAARLAEAALRDTLDAAAAVGAEPVLVLRGRPGPWAPTDARVLPQRGRRLDERLAAAFEDVGGPALLIGMDTPQVTPELLALGLWTLGAPEIDAVLGHAADGGWWALGLRRPDPRTLLGVPMSTPWTGKSQERRLRRLRLRVATLPTLRDVDTFADALDVARAAPGTRFAAAVDALPALAGGRVS